MDGWMGTNMFVCTYVCLHRIEIEIGWTNARRRSRYRHAEASQFDPPVFTRQLTGLLARGTGLLAVVRSGLVELLFAQVTDLLTNKDLALASLLLDTFDVHAHLAALRHHLTSLSLLSTTTHNGNHHQNCTQGGGGTAVTARARQCLAALARLSFPPLGVGDDLQALQLVPLHLLCVTYTSDTALALLRCALTSSSASTNTSTKTNTKTNTNSNTNTNTNSNTATSTKANTNANNNTSTKTNTSANTNTSTPTSTSTSTSTSAEAKTKTKTKTKIKAQVAAAEAEALWRPLCVFLRHTVLVADAADRERIDHFDETHLVGLRCVFFLFSSLSPLINSSTRSCFFCFCFLCVCSIFFFLAADMGLHCLFSKKLCCCVFVWAPYFVFFFQLLVRGDVQAT